MRGESIILGSVFLLCVTFDHAEFYTTVKTYCTLPDGHTSTCKPVEECESIVELINSTNPFTRKAQLKLTHYSCQYNIKEQTTHVCCPSGFITIPDEIPPPSDVSNHRNLNLLPGDCGTIESEDKIRKGENASLTEFPWMALLSYETCNGSNFECGATVINERYILTAAHCVTGLHCKSLVGVRVGEYNLALNTDCEDDYCLPPVQDLAIEKVLYPEDYNVTLNANDIALLRVTKINLDLGNVVPICLPISDELRNINVTKGVVTGWGYIDPHKTTTSILQKVLLERQDMSVCKKYYAIEPSIKLSFKQLCIGGKNKKDSCGGDSGGPLQIPLRVDDNGRYVQYGIVSTGPRYCGWVDAPGLYTNIVYYMDWILDNLEP